MKGIQRKEQIMGVTLEIIGSEGLAGLTVAKIAQKAQISEAALYKHFTGKDDIISHCIGLIEKRLMGTIQSVANENLPAISKLEKIFNIHMEHIQKNKGVPRVVYTAEVHSNKTFRTRLLAIIDNYIASIKNIIEDGQHSGQIKDSIDAPQSARRFLSMIQFSSFRYSLSGFDKNILDEGRNEMRSFTENIHI